MSRSIKLLLSAALLFAIAAESAAARQLSLSSSTMRVTWNSLEFLNTAGFATVRCNVTIEGSFHSRTIQKVLGSLIGLVTSATVAGASCTGGSVTVLREALPWHLQYDSFEGSLPTINQVAIRIIGAGWQIRNEALTCLMRTEHNEPMRGIANLAGGVISSFSMDPSRKINATGTFCDLTRFFLQGTGTMTILGSPTSIALTLI